MLPLLLIALAFAGDPITKTFTLSDGRVITGQVIDEGESAYLVRVGDTTVRVEYTAIASVTVDSPMAPEAIAGPPVYVSKEGVRFRSSDAMLRYDRERLVLEVRDETVGTWRSTTSGASVALTPDVSIGSARAHGTYSDSVVAAYRIATGEGVVLATFRGEVLEEGTRIFRYLQKESDFTRHGHWEGDDPEHVQQRRAKRAVGVSMIVTGVVAIVGAVAWSTAGDPDSPAPYVVGAAGMVVSATGIGLTASVPVPRPKEWVLDPWRLDAVMVYVRTWNDTLRSDLGAE